MAARLFKAPRSSAATAQYWASCLAPGLQGHLGEVVSLSVLTLAAVPAVLVLLLKLKPQPGEEDGGADGIFPCFMKDCWVPQPNGEILPGGLRELGDDYDDVQWGVTCNSSFSPQDIWV